MAQTPIRIDRRVELLSIVNALAGFKEYTMGKVNPYRTAVVTAFRPYLQHPAVVMARDLRAKHGIGFDAPMIFAVHLDDQLQLQNAEELPTIDKRWTGVDAEAYAEKLRAFVTEAKLDEFMAGQRPYYDQVEEAFRAGVAAENAIPFLDGVFGKRDKARFTVIPAPMMGTLSVGVRATRGDGTLDLYQLISIDTSTALPVINADFTYLLVHETAHSYVNPRLAQHAKELAAPAEALFAKVKDKMAAQAYGNWETFLNESVVRAATVLYFAEAKGRANAEKALAFELGNGFLWTKELANILGANRAKDGKDYVPVLVTTLASLK